jgi:putative endonuclease
MSESEYYVYILSSVSGVLYVGVTNDLTRRVHEHKQKLVPGFTSRYNMNQLVYFESTPDVSAAVAHERQIKGWRRSRKVDLVHSMNPKWEDLAANWYDEWGRLPGLSSVASLDRQRPGPG